AREHRDRPREGHALDLERVPVAGVRATDADVGAAPRLELEVVVEESGRVGMARLEEHRLGLPDLDAPAAQDGRDLGPVDVVIRVVLQEDVRRPLDLLPLDGALAEIEAELQELMMVIAEADAEAGEELRARLRIRAQFRSHA